MKKRLFGILLTVAMLFSGVVPTLANSNGSVKLTQKEKTDLIKTFKSEGLSSDIQDKLIQKIEKGELPDSINPEKIKQVPKDALTISEKEPHKKYVFPDGSFIDRTLTVRKKIEVNPENRSQLIEAIGDPQKVDQLIAEANRVKENTVNSSAKSGNAIINSTFNNGNSTYYFDIWIQSNGNLTGGGFFADFVIVWGGADYITKVSDPGVWATGGSYSISYLGIDRPYEGQYSSTPAKASLRWEYFPLGVGGATYRTYLYVGNNSYWSALG